MTKTEQLNFIYALIDNVRADILARSSSFPEDWDGVELRQYIADKFTEVCFGSLMTKQRKREYNNTVLVNNL